MSNQLRIAVIDKNKCKPKKCGHECKRSCPVNITGKQCIEIEDIAKISEELCIGCHMCVKRCPFDAIKIINLPTPLKNHLIHSYGENLFKLYKLPKPKIGTITGILGPNGCGKTTIMNILAKGILPTFGKDKITEAEILKNVRGTELQKYLKLLYTNKLSVNVKQQNIVSLVKKIKDTNLKVGDIIQKYSNHPKYNQIIETLEINKLMDHEILTLSGGELQKMVCTVSLLKDGNVFIFDEPTNYLDIEYRIKVANLIKDLVSEDKYIFVVEHDLSILDFVADYLHIMYGEPGAYGVLSTLYSTLEGINIYFEGYIPADNIRFRDEPFKLVEQNLVQDGEQLYSNLGGIVSYDEKEIKFNHFHLQIKGVQIDNQINMIVILGKNGCGKTTYLNFLQKELELTISYKPQINKDDFDNPKITVKELLMEKIKVSMISAMFYSDVIKLLNVHKIYDKKVKKLSGGELQRLSICLCLGKPADIYLLDEPSASLDIEQRFNTTKVIKRFLLHNHKVGFIVEHDILMTIALAKEQTSRVMVFEEINYDDDHGIRYCQASELLDFNTGINKFLKSINTTFRTDNYNNRPRINKIGSVLDQEQKKSGKYFN